MLRKILTKEVGNFATDLENAAPERLYKANRTTCVVGLRNCFVTIFMATQGYILSWTLANSDFAGSVSDL